MILINTENKKTGLLALSRLILFAAERIESMSINSNVSLTNNASEINNNNKNHIHFAMVANPIVAIPLLLDNMSAGELRITTTLFWYNNEFGKDKSFPSVAKIAKCSQTSEATVKRCLRKYNGIFLTKTKRIENGKQTSNNYALDDVFFWFIEYCNGAKVLRHWKLRRKEINKLALEDPDSENFRRYVNEKTNPSYKQDMNKTSGKMTPLTPKNDPLSFTDSITSFKYSYFSSESVESVHKRSFDYMGLNEHDENVLLRYGAKDKEIANFCFCYGAFNVQRGIDHLLNCHEKGFKIKNPMAFLNYSIQKSLKDRLK